MTVKVIIYIIFSEFTMSLIIIIKADDRFRMSIADVFLLGFEEDQRE